MTVSTEIQRLAALNRESFNKFHPAELIGQAISVLEDPRFGVEEGSVLADELRAFSRRLEPAWKHRDRRATVAGRRSPPSLVLSGPKRYGLMPMRSVFGEMHEDPRKRVLMHGDQVRDRNGKDWLFAGLSEDNQPILATDGRDLNRKKVEIEKARLRYESPSKTVEY